MTTKYDNSGAIFKNERTEKDTHPDYTGTLTVNGQELWVSAWIKSGQKGKFMSLSVKPKEERQEQRAPARQLNQPTEWTLLLPLEYF